MKLHLIAIILLCASFSFAQSEVQITPGQVGAYGGAAGDILTVAGTTTLGHTHITRAALATALAPSLTVGGDLSGALSNAQIVANAVGTAELAGASVTMAKIAQDGAASGQVLKWSGTAWTPSADNVGSVTSGNLTGASTKITVTGGTSAILGTGVTLDVAEANLNISNMAGTLLPSKIQSGGATTGQVLKYNGTSWAAANDADAQTLTRTASSNTITVFGGGSASVEDEMVTETFTPTSGTTVTVTGALLAENSKIHVERNGVRYIVGASGCSNCNATRAALVFTFSRAYTTGETVSFTYPKQ